MRVLGIRQCHREVRETAEIVSIDWGVGSEE